MSRHGEAQLDKWRPSQFGARGLALCAVCSAAACVMFAALGCEESRAPAKTTQPTASSVTEASASAPTTSEPKSASTTETEATPVAAKIAEPAAAPPADDGAPRNITFDKIKFDLKANADYKAEMLTPEIKALDGHNVRIRGFMFPSFKATGLTEWVLVRDNLQCCFGGNAILYDCIIVDMKPGKSTDYTTRPVAVEGTFKIRDWFDIDGVRRAIYHLDGESVRF